MAMKATPVTCNIARLPERTLHLEAGDRIQFYQPAGKLMFCPGAPGSREPIRLLLDHELHSREDEVTPRCACWSA